MRKVWMYKLTVLYGSPVDRAAFDRHYREVHVPLARRMRGLARWTLTWVDEQDGPLPGVHLIADLVTSDRATLDEMLASPEGRAARQDVEAFADDVTFCFGEEQEVELA